ncbi:MAG: CHC2 zinc finger domain-containing protein [bacterium]
MDTIKQISIIDVAKRLGINIRGNKAMCFGGHDNKTQSLNFSLKKNLWKCFGCDKGGDNINLVMEVENCNFNSALDWFVQEFQVDVRYNQKLTNARFISPPKKSQLRKIAKEVPQPKSNEFFADSKLYSWLLNQCSIVKSFNGTDYLKNHGISQKISNKFGIRELINPAKAFSAMLEYWGPEKVYRSGLAWGEYGSPRKLIWSSYTLLIPFYLNKKITYLQGRLFNKEPKFLNLRGISKPIYNINCIARMKRGDRIHICEGAPDVLALESEGLKAVAILGASSFREEWVDLFIPFEVVLLPDGDSGGVTFQNKISQAFNSRGKSVSIINLPKDCDVASVIAKMGSGK